ncbi:hypothetical protein ACIRVK_23525 [Streptomyces sp. NPDC101152]|uniref:hypothetical protein n=1 Tax=Streptomyces sp. NPDC101152 TaxID=3366116 RepID=UPI00382B67F5
MSGQRAAGSGQRVQVRVVKAWLTVVLVDGTRRTKLWCLLTNLLDADSRALWEIHNPDNLAPCRQW